MSQDFSSSVREKWGFYMEETEKNYTEATTAVDSGRSCLAEVLVEWSVRHYLESNLEKQQVVKKMNVLQLMKLPLYLEK